MTTRLFLFFRVLLSSTYFYFLVIDTKTSEMLRIITRVRYETTFTLDDHGRITISERENSGAWRTLAQDLSQSKNAPIPFKLTYFRII